MRKRIKNIIIFFALFVASVFAHNLAFAVFRVEEPFFFLFSLAFFAIFAALLLLEIVMLFKRTEDFRISKREKIILALSVAPFLAGLYFYSQMPDYMITHWNIEGRPDAYASKFWGLFGIPTITLAMVLLFLLIPRIDPLKENVKKFRVFFDWFIGLMVVFMIFLYSLVIMYNSGLRFDIGRLIAPALGVVFYVSGVLMEKSKRNWFIGVKTPWTLSSDIVWEKTNKLAGRIFKAVGLISAFGLVIGSRFLFVSIIVLLGVVFYLIVYSYFEYQKTTRRGSDGERDII